MGRTMKHGSAKDVLTLSISSSMRRVFTVFSNATLLIIIKLIIWLNVLVNLNLKSWR